MGVKEGGLLLQGSTPTVMTVQPGLSGVLTLLGDEGSSEVAVFQVFRRHLVLWMLFASSSVMELGRSRLGI